MAATSSFAAHSPTWPCVPPRATLINTTGLLENISTVDAGPFLAAGFCTGLRLGGLRTGVCPFSSLTLFSTTISVLVAVRPPRGSVE
ncbi:uncharacterized protein SPSK_10674 [Sporothrix schenckii 1099-18]|uniref:Uncharacterized protein n=1 Tax=Sporothrix schenckii 1099-18 TaxID=1397361 RepID=A0A0F2LV23_SPOSC|nr:uncharacterized protein SPSK_10674 [Sporothrix schenckii 1099-18]KJR80689.1 hypothetical protein SPSK_10674 [Sporothrix schenckii 1099-18]